MTSEMGPTPIAGITAAIVLSAAGLAQEGNTGKMLLVAAAATGAISAASTGVALSKNRKRFAPILDVEKEIRGNRLRFEEQTRKARADFDEECRFRRTKVEQDLRQSIEKLGSLERQIEAAKRSASSNQTESERLERVRAQLANEINAQEIRLENLSKTIEVENDLKMAGFAARRYLGIDSDALLERLKANRANQKELGKRILGRCDNINFTYNNSASKGKAFAKRTVMSWLRGFNAECDAAISSLKHSNDQTVLGKIDKAFSFYAKKAEQQKFPWDGELVPLKEEEAYLVHEHHLEKQREKDEQAAIRREMREEERAQREAEEAKEAAERDAEKYEELLRKAREEAYSESDEAEHLSKIAELERRVAEAEANRERAISRAQMTRSGHVYVISNVGAFGQEVFKVGMSRRLDPMERVKELGDASVPFPFDVHAMIFTEDAPTFEKEIHHEIWDHRVNRVNERREFFQISMPQLEEATRRVAQKLGMTAEIRWTRYALAEQYRQSVTEREAESHGAISESS